MIVGRFKSEVCALTQYLPRVSSSFCLFINKSALLQLWKTSLPRQASTQIPPAYRTAFWVKCLDCRLPAAVSWSVLTPTETGDIPWMSWEELLAFKHWRQRTVLKHPVWSGFPPTAAYFLSKYLFYWLYGAGTEPSSVVDSGHNIFLTNSHLKFKIIYWAE